MDRVILVVLYFKKHGNNGCRFKFVGVGGGPVLLLQYSQYACLKFELHQNGIFFSNFEVQFAVINYSFETEF